MIGLVGGAALNTDAGNRFVYTCNFGLADMGLFFRNARGACLGPDVIVAAGARGVELVQYYIGKPLGSLSGYEVEDLVSNHAGRVFGDGLSGSLASAKESFLRNAGAVKWGWVSRPLIEKDQADYRNIKPMAIAKLQQQVSTGSSHSRYGNACAMATARSCRSIVSNPDEQSR